MVFDNCDNFFYYILVVINFIESYVYELGCEFGVYYFGINSEFDSVDGKKYGFGFLVVVIVVIVKVLCQFYYLLMDKNKLFKLVVIVYLFV